MGALRVGDVVTDPTTGGHSTIIGVFPQGEKPIYKVSFDDGASCRVTLDHLWAYKVPNHLRPRTKRSSQREFASAVLGAAVPDERWNALKVGPTSTLMDWMKKGENPRVPLTEPVLYTVNGRAGTGSVPAYLAGLLLGDGHIESLSITSCDDEIRAYLSENGFRPSAREHTDGKSMLWRVAGKARVQLRAWVSNQGLSGKLSWQKFIPDYVQTSSLEYRLDFLRGLMDTDGTVDERGRCYFTSTSEALADGVRQLVRSLGGKASKKQIAPTYSYKGEKKEGRPAWTLRLWMRKNSAMFNLSRKKERCTDSWNGGHELMREIVAIEPDGVEEAVCIQVDTPYGLYLTDDYVVTHNTYGLLLHCANRDSKYGRAFRGLFARRTLPELVEVERLAEQMFRPLGWKWSKTEREWTGRNGGNLRLRYLADDSDAAQYQGHQLTDVIIDEAGNFPSLSPIDMLWGSLRSPEGIPCYMRLSANPGGPGHAALYERYVKWGDGIIHRWQPQPELKPNLWVESVFIKSTLADNPALLAKDPGYADRLALVGDKDLYRAWMYGDWDILRGGYFTKVFNPRTAVYQDADLEPYFTRWIGIDWGYSHSTCVYFACNDGTNTYVYKERLFKELTPTDLAYAIVEANGGDKLSAAYLSPDAFARRSTPRAISDEMMDVFRKEGLPVLQRADNNRVSGWQLMADMFQKGCLKIHESCEVLRKAIPMAQRNPDRPEDILKTSGQEDDALDACRYLLQSHPRDHVVPYEVALQRAITAEDPSWKLVQYQKAKVALLKRRAPVRIGANRP